MVEKVSDFYHNQGEKSCLQSCAKWWVMRDPGDGRVSASFDRIGGNAEG